MEDEVVNVEIDSFDKLSIVDFSIVGKTFVAIDIRNISIKEDKRRVMDFVTGLSIGRGCSIRQINKEGVYLLNPNESNSEINWITTKFLKMFRFCSVLLHTYVKISEKPLWALQDLNLWLLPCKGRTIKY